MNLSICIDVSLYPLFTTKRIVYVNLYSLSKNGIKIQQKPTLKRVTLDVYFFLKENKITLRKNIQEKKI
jgi:hypothetical protein